ncbi:tryptophan halogenase [Alteromonas sp. 345S023]|uniref:Tryptophan halogenase n=1 Tax=Alteromonas profundi TaxID=2696062 RepID=A0A7X5RJW7_9ALTE|nr:tryptophan halogenase family protein [Alteromonas profundi]NDV90363.1 tryptophan halogenase [Alteromonas profundi]
MTPINRIVIVGGGTAGWLTAGLLAAKHSQANKQGQSVSITVVESNSVHPIGVGEGTWPTMRRTLAKIGISEHTLITKASATFKQASKFVGWHHTNKINDENKNSRQSHYYHPFSAPQGSATADITPYWLSERAGNSYYADDVCFQPSLCEAGLAPKLPNQAKSAFCANYGYHLDAGEFIALLREHCTQQLNVHHLIDDVVNVATGIHGIEALTTLNNGEIKGDLYIDCSGFNALLIEKALGVELKDASHHLFADSALVCQAPYEQENAPIACHTLSSAQTAGWIWDIGLQHRRGTGYVHSSAHQSSHDALHTFTQYLGSVAPSLAVGDKIREIKFKTGYRHQFWKQNCIAIGLSSGFLEPLEASSLMLIEQSASLVAEQLPAHSGVMPHVAKRVNATLTYLWERTIEFLKLHYVLSNRTEDFWQDNRNVDSIPARLAGLLDEWKYRPVLESDFTSATEAFSAQSYRYILYGMVHGNSPFCDSYKYMHTPLNAKFASKQLQLNHAFTRQLHTRLPSHRGLIESYYSAIR